jgi:hypothetical protein
MIRLDRLKAAYRKPTQYCINQHVYTPKDKNFTLFSQCMSLPRQQNYGASTDSKVKQACSKRQSMHYQNSQHQGSISNTTKPIQLKPQMDYCLTTVCYMSSFENITVNAITIIIINYNNDPNTIRSNYYLDVAWRRGSNTTLSRQPGRIAWR